MVRLDDYPIYLSVQPASQLTSQAATKFIEHLLFGSVWGHLYLPHWGRELCTVHVVEATDVT